MASSQINTQNRQTVIFFVTTGRILLRTKPTFTCVESTGCKTETNHSAETTKKYRCSNSCRGLVVSSPFPI